MSICLDAFAVLAWLQDEPGANQVEDQLNQATEQERYTCYMSTINLGEVYYRLLRAKGVEEAEAFWQDVRKRSLPIALVEPTRNRVREAARLKGRFAIAYADAFAAQVAAEKGVSLMTGDKELALLEKEGLISIVWLI